MIHCNTVAFSNKKVCLSKSDLIIFRKLTVKENQIIQSLLRIDFFFLPRVELLIIFSFLKPFKKLIIKIIHVICVNTYNSFNNNTDGFINI